MDLLVIGTHGYLEMVVMLISLGLEKYFLGRLMVLIEILRGTHLIWTWEEIVLRWVLVGYLDIFRLINFSLQVSFFHFIPLILFLYLGMSSLFKYNIDSMLATVVKLWVGVSLSLILNTQSWKLFIRVSKYAFQSSNYKIPVGLIICMSLRIPLCISLIPSSIAHIYSKATLYRETFQFMFLFNMKSMQGSTVFIGFS